MIAKVIAARERALKTFLERRSIVAWAAVLGVVLVSPSLFLGLQADDHAIRMTAHGEPGISEFGSSPWYVFTFADGDPAHNATRIDWGLIPWWSAPALRLSFLRPLSSISHAFDYWCLEPHWWAMHIENMLLYAALCACVALLYRRFGVTPWVAGFAALIYAADDTHGIPAGWLAGRNAVLTCLFGAIALMAHDAWRRGGSKRAACGAVIALALGFACGEAAIFVFGYLIAYALCIDTGSVRARMLSLAPYCVVLAVYLAIYVAYGFGTRDSGLYSDPFRNPIGFAIDIALNLPALVQAQLGILSSNAYVVVPPRYQFILHAFDYVMIALFAVAFYPVLRASKLARFWALGMVLSLPPVCATVPNDRLLCPAGIGGMALIGHYLEYAFGRWNESPPQPRQRFVRRMAIFLLFTHAFIGPLSLPFNSTSVRMFGRIVESGVARLPLDDAIRDKSIIVVNPKVDAYTITIPAIQSSQRAPVPRHTWGLNAGLGAMAVLRTDETTLEIEVEEGFFPKPFGVAFHGPSDPWAVGRTVKNADFEATILELTADNLPKRIRFVFNRPLEDPSYLWFYFGERNIEPFPLPAVGESVVLPGKTIIEGIRAMFRLAMSPAA